MIRINTKYIDRVEEIGRWARIVLKNGLVLEERADKFQLFEGYVYYDKSPFDLRNR